MASRFALQFSYLIVSSSSIMTNRDLLPNGYTFKFVSFFISLIAFFSPIVKLFSCFFCTSFYSLLLTHCSNLSAFPKYLSFFSSSTRMSAVWMMSMCGRCLLSVERNFGPKVKTPILFLFSPFPLIFMTPCLIIFFAGVVLLMLLKIAFFKF